MKTSYCCMLGLGSGIFSGTILDHIGMAFGDRLFCGAGLALVLLSITMAIVDAIKEGRTP